MKDTQRLEIFTIAARNYLAHAFVLGDSVLRHHPDTTFSVFLMDDANHEWKQAIEERGFRVIYPEDIPFSDFRKFVFQYNVTEASTGVKPSIIRMLLERGAEKVIYLDPDILCLRRLSEVLDALDHQSIVLTPHICVPDSGTSYPGNKTFLSMGIFNLGFIAVRNSPAGVAFAIWWSGRLKHDCVQEPDAGLYVDQKWVDLVPACFDGVWIMRNRAYNIAYWNLHERCLEQRNEILFEYNSGEPVAFIHFSGFAVDDINRICKYPSRNPFSKLTYMQRYTLGDRPDLVGAFQLYRKLLIGAGVERFSKIPYAYSNYDSGEPISQLERSLFLTSGFWSRRDVDPFSVTGADSFRSACRRAGVRASSATGKLSTHQAPSRYRAAMRLIESFLTFCLRVLGPSRYLDFAKYVRHQLLPLNHGFLLARPKDDSCFNDVKNKGASDRNKALSGTQTVTLQ